MSMSADTLSVSVNLTPSQIPTIQVGMFMPKINLDLVEVEELDEAISHLRATQINTHDLRIAKWCSEEIDRMLDAKLELDK
jgi:hypothetical protein